MNILRNMSVTVAVLLPLVVSCVAPGYPEDGALGVARQGSGGTTNGADPDINAACQPAILSALNVPLVVTITGSNEEALNPELDGALAAGEKCEQPLYEAYRCAGAIGTSLPGPQGVFNGQELMSTATSWRTAAGLSYSQQVDVLTCMTTLLNPNEGVPICLDGAHVSGTTTCSSYIVEEAVWLSLPTLGAGNGVMHYVWPLIGEITCQPDLLDEILRQRICGPTESAGDCGLVVMDATQVDDDCPQDEYGRRWCGELAAITTYLTTAGFETMYSGCRNQR